MVVDVTSTCRTAQEVRLGRDSTYQCERGLCRLSPAKVHTVTYREDKNDDQTRFLEKYLSKSSNIGSQQSSIVKDCMVVMGHILQILI